MENPATPSAVARGGLAPGGAIEPPRGVWAGSQRVSSGDQTVVSAPELGSPPNRAGKLRVVDERTGRSYEVHVSEDGTVKATDLKKITMGKDDKGFKLYDPGYLNTAPVQSTICYIDGDAGILRY